MWIKKVYKQHGSMVLTLPKAVQQLMKLRKGDYLMIHYKHKKKALLMLKVVHGDTKNKGSKSSTNNGHHGRSTRSAGS